MKLKDVVKKVGVVVITGAMVTSMVSAEPEKVGDKDRMKPTPVDKLLAPFSDVGNPPSEIPMKTDEIKLLLKYVATQNAAKKGEINAAYQALLIGTPTDGADLDATLRRDGFDAVVSFLRENTNTLEKGDEETYWLEVAMLASSASEQMKVTAAMQKQTTEWAYSILDYFIED